jgi:MoxR-like ATPase
MIVRRAVATHSGSGSALNGADPAETPDTSFDWINLVVELVRATRDHADVRVGSSVRGAIDMVFVANSLAELRGVEAVSPRASLDAALVALSGRIRVREGSMRTPEEIVTELWESIFQRTATDGEDGEGKAGAPMGAMTST